MVHQRRAWLALSGLLIVVVIGLRAWLQWVGPLPGDGWSSRFILEGGTHNHAIRQVAEALATVASPVTAAATIIVAIWALYRREGIRAAAGMCLAAGVILLDTLLKQLWGVTPELSRIQYHSGANYPSGHTAYAGAVLGYIAVQGRRRDQREVMVVALALLVGMGPARIAIGAHLVSDVVGGYLLGAAWLILTILWTQPSLLGVEGT